MARRALQKDNDMLCACSVPRALVYDVDKKRVWAYLYLLESLVNPDVQAVVAISGYGVK